MKVNDSNAVLSNFFLWRGLLVGLGSESPADVHGASRRQKWPSHSPQDARKQSNTHCEGYNPAAARIAKRHVLIWVSRPSCMAEDICEVRFWSSVEVFFHCIQLCCLTFPAFQPTNRGCSREH